MSDQPIAEHALLSDCHSAALVDRFGSVEWWPAPRFDSPSIFSRLLDDRAGHFSIGAADVVSVERKYLDGSLVLASTVTTNTGTYKLTEALVMAEGARTHDLGLDSPQVLARHLVCVDGQSDVRIEIAPRFEYGLSLPTFTPTGMGLLARGGPICLLISGSIDLKSADSMAVAEIPLSEGQEFGIAVQAFSRRDPAPQPWTLELIKERLADTTEAWRSWEANHQNYEGPYSDLVGHSGRVLQAMTYAPTGALVAAPTTSLPETIGGSRNWDYRFSWVRDASYTLRALWVAACPHEAVRYLSYLRTSAGTLQKGSDMQIMFGIRGERDLTERTLPWLSGWRHSQPVRVGNDAWLQPQLDVYGELISAAHRLRDQLDLDDVEKAFFRFLADRAGEIWDTPDHGIWEVRGDARQFLHSKLMCWVALDRAIDMADTFDAEERVSTWTAQREQIRQAILERGWSDEIGAFTQVFGSRHLDASSLLIPLVGFLPFDDPRVVSTIQAVRETLSGDRGLVYRYLGPDGLEGDEGAFLLCSFWMVQALAGIGKLDDAIDLFETAISYRNDVDLLSEEIDITTGEMLGNFPQGFSHVGLINAAWAIARSQEGKEQRSETVGD